METDRAYFVRRASEEREAALTSSGKVQAAHLEMAFRYEDLASAIAMREYALEAGNPPAQTRAASCASN